MTITEDADYHGLRVTFTASLGNARVRMQLDLGFGDDLNAPPQLTDYPTILNFPAPRLYGYSRETAIAEKFEALLMAARRMIADWSVLLLFSGLPLVGLDSLTMQGSIVKLGPINSRMKDFFDIRLLSRRFEFAGDTLADAIARTFTRRDTRLDLPPYALTREFAELPPKRAQLQAFLEKSRLPASVPLNEVIEDLAAFLLPVAASARDGKPLRAHWLPPGPWTMSSSPSGNP